MKSAASIIAASLLLALAGCTATCLRDSDCIGSSVCLQDRCVLLTTARDGGGSAPIMGPTPPPPRSPSPTPTPPPRPAIGDAGSDEVGSDATATRGFLDAAIDSASPAPGP